MHIREITDKSVWEAFLQKQSFTPFVQAWEYGEFYRSLKEQAWIFGLYKENTLIGGSLVVSTHAKRGNFLYLPYGPVLDYTQKDHVKVFVEYLKDFGKKRGYDFIRLSPFIDETHESTMLFSDLGFRPAPMHVLAETTWLLSLEKTEEILLKEMNKNHRNLVHRCEREQVRVEMRTDREAIDIFNNLLDVTAKRHNFFRFPRDYVTEEFDAFVKQGKAAVFLAYLPSGELDSGAVIMYHGCMGAYRHGASLGLDKKLPTSYLIQWRAIQEAKKRGKTRYNFWGIAPESAPASHPFKGITHFKKGFGGYQKDLLHCQDVPLSKRYWINWVVETFRRHKRGF